jgi:hypothetical protein
MSKPKISIGVPFYGMFSGEWATQSLQFVAKAAMQYDLRDIITCGTMTADHNRNTITQEFLKSDAEWLFWIDSDTLIPVGALSRLLGAGKTLVSGLYYGKNEPHNPIAYHIYNGAFSPINQQTQWEKGELLPVDATGMGCMLTHRSVFEEIEKEYEVYQLPGGGIYPIRHKNVVGKMDASHEHDGKIYRGQLRLRAIQPTLAKMKFPFFMVEHLRTEDMFFFDLARTVGHKPWLDTSVECGHLRWDAYTGEQWRKEHGH